MSEFKFSEEDNQAVEWCEKKSRKKRIQKDKAIYKQKYLNNLDNE